jgi:protein TonB
MPNPLTPGASNAMIPPAAPPVVSAPGNVPPAPPAPLPPNATPQPAPAPVTPQPTLPQPTPAPGPDERPLQGMSTLTPKVIQNQPAPSAQPTLPPPTANQPTPAQPASTDRGKESSRWGLLNRSR